MATQNAIFGTIIDVSRESVTLTGGTARFDPADQRTGPYVAVLEDLRRRSTSRPIRYRAS